MGHVHPAGAAAILMASLTGCFYTSVVSQGRGNG